MRKIILYSKSRCSSCANLKRYLGVRGIEYEEVSGDTAEGKTRMLTEGIFLAYFPALAVDGRLYQYADLFGESGEVLDLSEILS
jgi:glutaredoxin